MEENLVALGLNRNEAKVYVALLRLGAVGITEVGKGAGIHRTNVYDSIKSLQQKGLVSVVDHGGKQVFQAADPMMLGALLKAKETLLEGLLPSLRGLAGAGGKRQRVEVLEGAENLRRVLLSLLEKKQEIVVFGAPRDAPERVGRTFLSIFHKRRIQQKIFMSHIYDEDAKERIRFLNSLPYTEALWIKREVGSPATTVVCGDTVSFLIWSEPVVVVVVESEPMARAYRHYFLVLKKLARR